MIQMIMGLNLSLYDAQDVRVRKSGVISRKLLVGIIFVTHVAGDLSR